METATDSWKRLATYSLFAILLIFAYSWITSPTIISVTGVGEVTAKAELATMTFTLSSNAATPQEAVVAVRDNTKKIKENLKLNGILEGDIYESQASILPAAAVVAGSTGFQATISMGIKSKQITNLDSITNNLYALGAVVVTQPVLSVGDIEKLEKDAYNLALKDANKKSWGVALSNWKLIKKAVLIEQSQTQPSSTVTSKADSAMQIEENLTPDDGLIKVSKIVSVSYKLW